MLYIDMRTGMGVHGYICVRLLVITNMDVSIFEYRTLPLYISFQALGLFKWQLYVSMDESLKQQQQQWSGSLASEESDTFKVYP